MRGHSLPFLFPDDNLGDGSESELDRGVRLVAEPRIDREQLAWAAGFFDGEGCATLKRSSANQLTYPNLVMAQTDRAPLDRFHEAVGGLGNLRGPLSPPGHGAKQVYEWRVGKFEHVQAVVALLWQFLSRPKKDQIKRVFAEYHATPRRYHRPQGSQKVA